MFVLLPGLESAVFFLPLPPKRRDYTYVPPRLTLQVLCWSYTLISCSVILSFLSTTCLFISKRSPSLRGFSIFKRSLTQLIFLWCLFSVSQSNHLDFIKCHLHNQFVGSRKFKAVLGLLVCCGKWFCPKRNIHFWKRGL